MADKNINVDIKGDASGYAKATEQAAASTEKLNTATRDGEQQAAKYSVAFEKVAKSLGMTAQQLEAHEKLQRDLNETQSISVVKSADVAAAYEKQQAAVKELNSLVLKGGLAIAAFATALAFKVRSAIDAAASLQTLSDKTGIAVERLAALKYAADVSDTSLDSLARAFKQLPKSLVEAQNPNSAAGRGFSFLQIDPAQLKTQEQAIDAIANAIKRVEDPMAASAALQAILKRNGEELLPFFKQGADGIKQLTDEGARWNAVSGETAQNAKKLKDDMVTLDYSSQAFAKGIARDVVPWLSRMIEQLLEGQRIAGGLGKALLLLGTSNPFTSPGEQIKSLKSDIADVQALREIAVKTGSSTAGQDVSIAALQKQLEFAKLLQRQEALAGGTNFPDAASRQMDAERRAGLIKGGMDGPGGGTGRAKHEMTFEEVLVKNKIKWLEVGEKADQDATREGEKREAEKLRLAERSKAEADRMAAREEQRLDSLADKYRHMIDPLQKFRDEQKALWELFHEGRLSAEELDAGLDMVKKQMADLNKQAKDTTVDGFADLKKAVEGWGKDFSRELATAASSADFSFDRIGKSFQKLMNDIVAIQIQKRFTDPILKQATSWLDGVFKPGGIDEGGAIGTPGASGTIPGMFAAEAMGDVFKSSGLSAYSGRIVSRPTLFPFARGIGLMGEAGPEAVMPLKRGADGKLGVAGGGGNVTVNVINQGAPLEVESQSQPRFDGEQMVVDVFLKKMGRDAGFRDSVRGMLAAPR